MYLGHHDHHRNHTAASPGGLLTALGAGVILAVSLLGVPAMVAAAPLDITNITGGWSNPVAGDNIDIDNNAGQATDTIRWGDGTAPDSGYDFTPGPDIMDVPLDTVFLLGTFTHHNEPIPPGTSITAVDYDLAFDTNGNPSALGTALKFDHFETPNGDDPCADGGEQGVGININGCADIVTVTAATLNSPIDVNGEIFFFNLLGFSLDHGGTFESTFKSMEMGSNTVELYAIVGQRIDPPGQVSEPHTLLLLGLGLAAVGAGRSRRRPC